MRRSIVSSARCRNCGGRWSRCGERRDEAPHGRRTDRGLLSRAGGAGGAARGGMRRMREAAGGAAEYARCVSRGGGAGTGGVVRHRGLEPVSATAGKTAAKNALLAACAGAGGDAGDCVWGGRVRSEEH